MSEKRQRQQERRRRRKAQATARPRTSARAIDRKLLEAAAVSVRVIPEVTNALEAEQWASSLIATWREQAPPDVAEVLLARFVGALEALGTADGLAGLRALGALGDAQATAGADRLAAAGALEPTWSQALGRARPIGAALVEEPAFNDGVNVIVEFAEPDGGAHTLSVYVDHNLGGLAKHALVGGSLPELRAQIEDAPDHDRISIRELDLAEARARIDAALYMLDHTLDPPVAEELPWLRALIDARLQLLPSGHQLPDLYTEMPRAERDALLADFLASAEGERWRGDEDAEFVARLAIDFGADYNHAGPLRWSPAVVEIFMLDWLARKVAEEPTFFTRVPPVLACWVRYAGRRRGVPKQALREAIAAVDEYREEMLETVTDPRLWGPAKAIAAAAHAAGVDLTDRRAVEHLVRRLNDGLAA